MATQQGYWTEGKIINGVNVGGGTFVPGSMTPPPAVNTTLDSSTIGNVKPLNVPTINSTIATSPSVSPPIGTTVDANGIATIPPPPAPTGTPEKSMKDTIMSKFGLLGDTLATKGDETKKLQEEQQLAQKTERATLDYNAYNKAKLDLAQEIESIYTRSGGNPAGVEAQVRAVSRAGNANLANLAVQAQASQGLLSAAEKTIKDKIDAQFSPIQEEIDYLTKLSQMNNNDLTEKETFEIQQQAATKKQELADVTSTADTIQQTLLKNGAPPSIYSAIDKINEDFVNGKISSSEAKAKMYQATGSFGVDKTEQLQQQKITADIAKSKAEARQALTTLPSAVQTRVQGIAGQFDNEQSIKNYQTSAEAIDAVKTAGITPTDDIQRIYAFAKVMDPNSVVRETEYKTVQAYSTAVLQRYGLEAKRVFTNSGFLTDEARGFILKTLENRLASSRKAADNIYNEYGRRIDKVTGMKDGKDYITDYTKAFESADSAPVTSGKLPSGVTFKVIK